MLKVFEDTEFVKNDFITNPPSKYQEGQVYYSHLEGIDKTIHIFIETVYDYTPNYEVLGMFFDLGQWYTVHINLWKDPKKRSKTRIKLTPWVGELSKRELIYLNFLNELY